MTDPSRVAAYFPGDFRDRTSWERTIRKVSDRSLDRSTLVRVLSRQNRDFQCGVRTLANIDLLLNETCVAVVTGQQVGILGGPLYTLYKAITAVKLASQLAKEHPGYDVVPVFWIEGEDHDMAEVSTVKLITAANEVASFAYELEAKLQGKNLGPVGRHTMGANLEPMLGAIQAGLTPTEFTEAALGLVRASYQPGMTMTKAFVQFLNNLLEHAGLIFIDPDDVELKKLVAPVFAKELRQDPNTCQVVIERSDLLEQHYHAQVKPRPVNAFLFHHGGRYPIEPHPSGFSLKGVRQTFSREEMFALLKTSPELFSPNVVLRPICQDTMLPTVAYVAGPAEVAYFAQLLPLYPLFDLPAPIIYPRASATIIEERVDKVLTRFAIPPVDIFTNLDSIKNRVALEVSDFKTEELFGATVTSIDETLNALRTGLQKIDPTLLPPLDATLSKIRVQVDVLKQKTLAAQQRQHEVYLRQIDKAAVFLLPGGAFQERALNVLYYLNKYGPEFVRWLDGELRHDVFKHQIIKL
ncbi:MAG: bacillithiol biosynthesis cysteine-adding enzyme BshC [Bacteroidetes bacterium]|nr:bacillithiol biosynthesis cysteine-adding enzyme BshC [Bacteroidota bacterium]